MSKLTSADLTRITTAIDYYKNNALGHMADGLARFSGNGLINHGLGKELKRYVAEIKRYIKIKRKVKGMTDKEDAPLKTVAIVLTKPQFETLREAVERAIQDAEYSASEIRSNCREAPNSDQEAADKYRRLLDYIQK